MNLNITKLLSLVLVLIVMVSTVAVLVLSTVLVNDIERESLKKRRAEVESELNRWAVLRVLNRVNGQLIDGIGNDLANGVELVSIYDKNIELLDINSHYLDSDINNRATRNPEDLNVITRETDDLFVFPIRGNIQTNPITVYEDQLFSQIESTDQSNDILGYVIAKLSVEAVNASELQTRIITYFILAILLVVLLSLFAINRFIAAPIRQLSTRIRSSASAEVIDSIADMDIGLEEISNLANNFVAQHANIMEVNTTLELKVEERTKELGFRNQELANLAFKASRDSDDEARRIAAEVHDVLCSKLLKLKNDFDIASTSFQKNSSEQTFIAEKLSDLQKLNDDARLIVSRYRLNTTVYLGLRAGLEDTVDYICSGNEKLSEIEFVNDSQLIEGIDAIAFPEIIKITQEALLNVTKHSTADSVAVTIDDIDSTVRICIDDNGQGFTYQLEQGSHGLAIMRERANYIQGRLTIDSSSDGTSVELLVPTGSLI